MKRVTAMSGILFKSERPPQLDDWYEKHLSIQRESHGRRASFHWRKPQAAGSNALTEGCSSPPTTSPYREDYDFVRFAFRGIERKGDLNR